MCLLYVDGRGFRNLVTYLVNNKFGELGHNAHWRALASRVILNVHCFITFHNTCDYK